MQALDDLGRNVQLLLERYAALQQENAQLRETTERQRQEIIETHSELRDLQQRHKHLTLAHAMTAEAPEQRDKARQQLTNIIRQVDEAIAVLKQ